MTKTAWKTFENKLGAEQTVKLPFKTLDQYKLPEKRFQVFFQVCNLVFQKLRDIFTPFTKLFILRAFVHAFVRAVVRAFVRASHEQKHEQLHEQKHEQKHEQLT